VISIIAEQGGKQAPDLTDGAWDHGSSDGEIYKVIKRGVPPTMMAGWDGRMSDTEIWSIVNYLRALRRTRMWQSRRRLPPRHAPEDTGVGDFVQMPITGEPAGAHTRLLARVNFMI
jgi:hypothetical protein